MDRYEEFWKYHNADNMDKHTVRLIKDLKSINDKLVEALEKIRDLETDCCPRCEGEGNIYADGKAHYMSENAPTIPCGNCGGSGRILPEDAQDIAVEALKEAEL